MTPEYIEALAEIADPNKLWRRPPSDKFTVEERQQCDMGVALRRHASHLRRLDELLAEKRSLLITPLASHWTAVKSVDTPPDHEALRPDAPQTPQG